MANKIVNNLDAQDLFLIKNSPLPTDAGDLASKEYVDSINGVSKFYEAGEDLLSYSAVVLLNNKLYLANTTEITHQYSLVGITKTSALLGDIAEVQTNGLISLTGWGLIPNTFQKITDVSGMISGADQLTGLFTQIVGYSQDSDTLLINIQESILKE